MKTSKKMNTVSFLNTGMCGLALLIGVLALFFTLLPEIKGEGLLTSVLEITRDW